MQQLFPDCCLIKFFINSVKNPVKLEEIKCAIWESSILCNNDVISYIDDTSKLVSSDFVSNQYSAIVDFNQVSVIGDKFVTIGAWYDNEMGYSRRLIDLFDHMVKVDNDSLK